MPKAKSTPQEELKPLKGLSIELQKVRDGFAATGERVNEAGKSVIKAMMIFRKGMQGIQIANEKLSREMRKIYASYESVERAANRIRRKYLGFHMVTEMFCNEYMKLDDWVINVTKDGERR